jgi:hypothetical protein
VFEAEGTRVKRVGPVAPNLNGYAERWVQSLRTECLDHFVICGEGHLRHGLRVFLEYYNAERPHQARGNVPLPDAHAAPPLLALLALLATTWAMAMPRPRALLALLVCSHRPGRKPHADLCSFARKGRSERRRPGAACA